MNNNITHSPPLSSRFSHHRHKKRRRHKKPKILVQDLETHVVKVHDILPLNFEIKILTNKKIVSFAFLFSVFTGKRWSIPMTCRSGHVAQSL